ncbi:MAG: class I SAM-dependent methyltransferase [Acidimicrobiales bacterium]
MSLVRRVLGPVVRPVRRVVRAGRVSAHNLVQGDRAVREQLDASGHQLEVIEQTVTSSNQTFNDHLALQAATLRRVQGEIDAFRVELVELRKAVAGRLPPPQAGEAVGARLADIDDPTAWFLNYAGSHLGPMADAGWWINHPLVMEWRRGQVGLGAVNERIMEQPFVFAAVASLAPGSRVLDIGGAESTVGFSLASLGYDVTVIEPQGYPFTHPNLTVIERPLEEFEPVAPFDAVILLSTIEHFGIGSYAGGPDPDPDADLSAMAVIRGWTADNGLLVLTTPYGPAAVTELERIYDRARLDKLLSGWTVRHALVGHRIDPVTWTLESDELIDPPGPGRVVMVVAVPDPDPA